MGTVILLNKFPVRPEDVDKFFGESLAYGTKGIGPFEHARTVLDYGRKLREIGRAGDAVPHLQNAFTAFAQLGAEPWLAQVLSELEACGTAPPGATTDPYSGLGERKLQLALALARGKAPEGAAEHLLLTVPARQLRGNRVQSR